MKIIFIINDFLMGGVETYLLRIFKWCYSKQIESVLVVDTVCNFDCQTKETINKYQVKVIELNFIKPKSEDLLEVNKEIASSKNTILLSFKIKAFFLGDLIIRKNKNIENLNHYYYVLHPSITSVSPNPVIDGIYKIIFKNIVKSMIANRNVFFMDEQTRNYCMNRFNLDSNDAGVNEVKIIRLGMEINNKVDIKNLEERAVAENPNILTMLRFDFPFKGYVIGLIHSFVKLKEKYPKIKLTIVGFGKSYSRVVEEISKISEEYRKDIVLLDKIDYENLDSVFKTATVYVGMGTTVLDATSRGVISIVASAFQYEDFSTGFFYEDFRVVGKILGEAGSDKFKFHDLMEEVLEMDKAIYMENTLKSYQLYVENYNIDVVMEEIISMPLNLKKGMPMSRGRKYIALMTTVAQSLYKRKAV